MNLDPLAIALYEAKPLTKNGKVIPWKELKPWTVEEYREQARVAWNFRINGEMQGN
jgi:hypothetical protein